MPRVSLRLFSCCWPRSNAIKASIGKSSQRICLTLEDLSLSSAWADLHVFTMEELKSVTRGFSTSNLIGQGGFGPVFKGSIDTQLWPGLMPQPVAVKLLDLEGSQGHKEWLAEVIILGQLRHPNLVKLIGYCHDEKQRLLVYEYMPKGSLESHLFFKNSMSSLPWLTRLKIAVGAAKGLAFLHDQADKPVIYRDFKSSNILLDENYNAKLSDFGLAKNGPQGDETHVTTRVMGTHGYAAPEYIMTGHLTTKSDVYSFGVVLLELLTGRCSVDKRRPNREKNLVEWAKPFILNPKKVVGIMDESLEGQFSINGAQKAAELVGQCLARSPKSRPNMATVVETLEPLLELKDIPFGPFIYTVVIENRRDETKEIMRMKDEGLERKEKVEAMKFIRKKHVIGHRHKIKFSHLAFQSHARLYRISSDNYENKIILSQE